MLSGFCARASLNNNTMPTRHIVHHRPSLLAPTSTTGIGAALSPSKENTMRAAESHGHKSAQERHGLKRRRVVRRGWNCYRHMARRTTRAGALVSLRCLLPGHFPIIQPDFHQRSTSVPTPLCPFTTTRSRPAKMPSSQGVKRATSSPPFEWLP